MSDSRCANTADMFKRPPWRPALGEKAMSSAERMKRMRAEIRRQIEEDPPERWKEATCAHVMNTGKLQQHHQTAWRRYGELKGFGLDDD